MSKDLKQRCWTFVGPTTCYAFMQAMGMVNDHLAGCLARDTDYYDEGIRRHFVVPDVFVVPNSAEQRARTAEQLANVRQ